MQRPGNVFWTITSLVARTKTHPSIAQHSWEGSAFLQDARSEEPRVLGAVLELTDFWLLPPLPGRRPGAWRGFWKPSSPPLRPWRSASLFDTTIFFFFKKIWNSLFSWLPNQVASELQKLCRTVAGLPHILFSSLTTNPALNLLRCQYSAYYSFFIDISSQSLKLAVTHLSSHQRAGVGCTQHTAWSPC